MKLSWFMVSAGLVVVDMLMAYINASIGIVAAASVWFFFSSCFAATATVKFWEDWHELE